MSGGIDEMTRDAGRQRPITAATRAFVAREQGLRIGHENREARSGGTFVSVDPTTEGQLGALAAGDADDVDAAVTAARGALDADAWGGASPGVRAGYLFDLADAVDAHVDQLAELETLDMGKPLAQARDDVRGVASVFRYYGGWPTKLEGTVNPVRNPYYAMTQLEPLGVCAAITPWNFPLVMASHKIGPALAAGNTVVLKPAEVTSYSTLLLADLAREVGLPPGVLNVVTGSGRVVGEALIRHPDVAKVSFTGSTPVGTHILEVAGAGMKKAGVELGGKTANIVFADADLDAVARSTAEVLWENAGQVCIAPTRMFVHEDVYDQVVEKMVAHTTALRLGDPLDAGTDIGPLASASQYETVREYIRIGQDEGARLVAGGASPAARGFFVEPTIFADVDNRMRIATEEIFGPVLGILRFRTEEEAVRMANDSAYDLSAALWTRDVSRALRLGRRLHGGTVWVNTTGRLDPAQSFGGYHLSGNSRELGRESVLSYTRSKSIMIDLSV